MGLDRIPIGDFLINSIWILVTILLIFTIYYLINIGNRYVKEEKKINIEKRNILLGIIGVIILYTLIQIFKKHEFLGSLLSTVFVSIIIAYALNPLINFLEEKGIDRGKGVLLVYIVLLIVIIILIVSVIPKSIKELKKLGTNFPTYINQLTEMLQNLGLRITGMMPDDMPDFVQAIEDSFIENIKSLENIIGGSIKGLFTGIVNIASKAVNIVLTPILTFYFLVDKDKFKNWVTNAIPEKYKEDTIDLATTIDESLVLFIRGRLIMSVYIAVATTIMLLVMDIDFAFVIGFITGLFDIVPYIGPFIGYLPALFFALLSSPMKAVWISLFFVLIQWIENNVLGPKIIGENMGIHPMTILLSIIVGGGIFGVFGMILSVPAVATVKIVYNFFKERREINREGN